MESYLIWYIVGGALLILEALSPGTFIFICFGLAGLLVALADQFSDLTMMQLLIGYFVLSFLLLIVVKPFLQSSFKMQSSKAKSYAEKLVGQEAMVFKSITKVEPGTVQLYDAGEIWHAKSEDGSEIGQGTTVQILAVDGNQLIVKSTVANVENN